MDESTRQKVAAAIGAIPSGLFILTARNDDHRTGMLASWVQQVSFQPPMVSVAVAKGRLILPVISGSRRFGLCQLPQNEKLIMRKFAGGIKDHEDPFLGMEMRNNTATHLPILANVLAYLECELTCHIDAEGDHDLFIGHVIAGEFLGGEPHVHLRKNGFTY